MARCDGCGAEIVWAETVRGRRQPFDRKPTTAGNRILIGRGPDRPPLAVDINVLVGGERYLPGLQSGIRSSIAYMPHHATCPKRDDFRNTADRLGHLQKGSTQ